MSPNRPRDALGRPLPPDTDPARIVPGVPDVDDLSDEDAWAAGLGYFEAGRPFHAHEVFEMRWRLAPARDRCAWQALAQWGAALTHEARGNSLGAARLAERALLTLGEAGHVPECVDLPLVKASCRSIPYRSSQGA